MEGQTRTNPPITQYMSFDRFFLLKKRLRIDDPDSIESGVPAPYNKVNEWANHIMKAATAAVIIGSNVGVVSNSDAVHSQSARQVLKCS